MPRYRLPDVLVCLIIALSVFTTASAQDTPSLGNDTTSHGPEMIARKSDTNVQQVWTSHFGFIVRLPNKARYNKLGYVLNQAGRSELVNFILPSRAGSITVRYYHEGRMVPKGFRMLDSIHVFDSDSLGRNGKIYRRLYILTEFAVETEVLLTPTGEAEYGPLMDAIFDSFVAPSGSACLLPQWRYGRDPSKYEHGRSPDYHLRDN